jgi:predicted NUDIX family phosphoesterase
MPRSHAEHNPQYKQWIPYVLLLDPQQKIAVYARQGTETRLHGLWSLGIGGHINPCDAAADCQPFSWAQTIRNCLRRELAEEYPAACRGRTTFLGLIHENQTSVGLVHLGLVFLHQLSHRPGPPGPELGNLQWLAPELIGRDSLWPLEKFEIWSQLALQLLPPLTL